MLNQIATTKKGFIFYFLFFIFIYNLTTGQQDLEKLSVQYKF